MRTIYRNARIYTVEPEMPWAEEMIVEGKKIVYVGKTTDETGDKVIDCGGKMIMPAFIDSHSHPGIISKSIWHVNLPLYDNVEDLLEFVRKYAQEHPKEEVPFLYFDYYLTELFDENGPRKELLDEVVSDRPCLLADFTDHMSWVNSKMLELMEVDKNTPDPNELEVYWRDPDGTPTGWVKEWAWLHHVDKMYENMGWYPEDYRSAPQLKKVYDWMTDYGFAGVFLGFLEGEEEIKGIYDLDKAGQLHHYVDASYRCDNIKDLPAAIQEAKRLSEKYTTDHLKLNTMKLFLDGTIASGNASMVEPLSNDPTHTNCGKAGLDLDELETYFRTCNDAGMDVHIHMVGDGSFRMACDAVEKIKNDIGDKWKIKVILAHCCLVHKDDRCRAAELGLWINATPHWNGGMYGESGLAVLGEKRWREQSAFMEFVESGAQIAYSTDTSAYFEFDRSDPFLGIQVGATRVDPQYPLDPEKYPGSVQPEEDQKIPLEELLRGFTIGGAIQMHWEDKTGSLKEGKLANFIVLSDNIFDVPLSEIKDMDADIVVFEGETVKGEF